MAQDFASSAWVVFRKMKSIDYWAFCSLGSELNATLNTQHSTLNVELQKARARAISSAV